MAEHIVFLDAKTYGDVFKPEILGQWGTYEVYETTSYADTTKRCEFASIVITNKVILDSLILEQCKSLKLVCVAATGMNNIDLDFAKRRGIIVKNITDYSTDSVAQITFGIILEQLNKTHYHDQYVKEGNYSQNDIFTHLDKPFYQMSGKTFGIIGLGNIGRKVAHIATAFGAKVIYHSLSGISREEIYEEVSMGELLEQSDIISIHSPLNEKSKGLIDYSKLELMKKTALIFNLGRGGIIVEEDLAKALNRNLIAGAGLDVFEKEPLPLDSPLLKIHDKNMLTLSPHIGWASKEARILALEKIFQHLNHYYIAQS